MDQLLSAGSIGNMFISLAFASALVSMIALFWAESQEGSEQKYWDRMGLLSFGLHGLSILGVIVTLFYMIQQHMYQYYYVWDHSSNELAFEYIISCFWEGQEGSFLLWCFWHSILGAIIMFAKHDWKRLVIGVIASIEVILTSMVLGIYMDITAVNVFYILLALIPAAYLGMRFIQQRDNLPLEGNFHLAAIILIVCTALVWGRGQAGFLDPWSWKKMFATTDGLFFGIYIMSILAFGVFYLIYIGRTASTQKQLLGDYIAGLAVLVLASVIPWFEADIWKVGSTPFLLLKEAFPDNEVYIQDPDFIPANGGGLSPLLQNYWMVIHPPTLFLGFASTIVPFAFVVGALIRGDFTSWIRHALPWTTFSVMILGVGIIMGGYWAYETLSFGGYWAWDPVENGSLVPWLIGVGSLHGMLIYQRSKSYLPMSMILIILTFLLVLYSTFLTRSGILGDTSVHTFTDLGLSGQLLLLVVFYLAVVIVLFTIRWKQLPRKEEDSQVWTAEFMLFLGVLVFVFSGAEIILQTSLPVFNKILGTNLAPPPYVQLHYYKWNIWFAVAFGILSGIGQFLWWKIGKNRSLSNALFRPFLLAVVLGSVVALGIAYSGTPFVYQEEYAKIIDPARIGDNFLLKAWAYMRYAVVALADEILLYSSLFVVFANLDVLFSLIRKNRKGLKVMGGTVAHIGFGLMLLGILFSSGYDRVVSKNIQPQELASMSKQDRVDNILLPKDLPRYFEGYRVTYEGKKIAQGPISRLEIIETNPVAFKVKFKDSTGDVFGVVLPMRMFGRQGEGDMHTQETSLTPESDTELAEIDMDYVEEFLNANLSQLNPSRLNNRMLYGIRFESLEDSSDNFVLYPESEISDMENGAIISHPSRKVRLHEDLYVHVSQIPDPSQTDPKYEYHDLHLKMGEPFELAGRKLVLNRVLNLTDEPNLKEYQIAAAAEIITIDARDTLMARPIYLVTKDNQPGMIEARMPELNLDFAFVSIDPQTETMSLQARELTNPFSDYVVIKAISKPMINLLWLGTFVMVAGFLISIYRRVQENRRLAK